MNRPHRNTLRGGVIVLAIAGLGTCNNARAQKEQPLQFVTLDCLLKGQSSTTMEGGKLARGVPKDTLAITLTNFDYSKGTAMMIGNAGADEATFIPSYRKFTLIQFSATNNAVVTKPRQNAQPTPPMRWRPA